MGRAATPADVRDFYPNVTSSFRAWVCEVDGRAEGIIGMTLTRPQAAMFSMIRDPLKPYLKSLTCLRLLKKAEMALKNSRVPVLAIAEPGEPEAPKILGRLGFKYAGEHDGNAIYGFTPGEVSEWPKQFP